MMIPVIAYVVLGVTVAMMREDYEIESASVEALLTVLLWPVYITLLLLRKVAQ